MISHTSKNPNDDFITYSSSVAYGFDHLCTIGHRQLLKADTMSTEELLDEIQQLNVSIERRMLSTSQTLVSLCPYASNFMTDRESSRMHDLKMALPSFGDERKLARARILKRRAERSARRRSI